MLLLLTTHAITTPLSSCTVESCSPDFATFPTAATLAAATTLTLIPPQPQRLILPTLLDPQFSLWLYLWRACHPACHCYSCSSSCSSHPSFPSTPSECGTTPYPHPHHPSFVTLPPAPFPPSPRQP